MSRTSNTTDVAHASRIQRRRTEGWRMPIGAIYAGRPTKLGNPFSVDECGERLDPGTATALYRYYLSKQPELVAIMRQELRSKIIACWCALDEPCHVDVILEYVNTPYPVISPVNAVMQPPAYAALMFANGVTNGDMFFSSE